jgi:hypothetical protein
MISRAGRGSDAVTDRLSIQQQMNSDLPAGAKPNSGWIWALVFLLMLARAVSFFFLKSTVGYTLVPRSFDAGGFQSCPAFLDLLAPCVVILVLFSRSRFANRAPGFWKIGTANAALFLLFPLAAGMSMFAYESRWQFLIHITIPAFLRWLQFVLAYVAWNLILDHLCGRSSLMGAALLLAVSLGLLEDASPGMADTLHILLSVGLTLIWTVFALRRLYGKMPLAAILAAAEIGTICCFLVVMAASDSFLVFFLSLIALPIAALALRAHRMWPRFAALAAVAGAGLLLSVALPRFFSPDQRAALLTQDPPPSHTEQVDGITVRYDDPQVRQIALEMGKVLAAANRVSEETYGISPDVRELVVRGFAPGGFEAEFPHSIHGDFVSPKQVSLSLDSVFLNGSTDSSIDFPDPVNAILHEYSHLYGTVPYQPWVMGAEEEGWATFSATRLSQQLYRRYGSSLWSPAYNYAARADAIAKSNLAGHSVYWSHPNEFAGFQLWQALCERLGERNLYRERWALTQRSMGGWWFQENDPNAARNMARHFEGFSSLGMHSPIAYRDMYSWQEVQKAEFLMGVDLVQAKAAYDTRAANGSIDPAIRVPPRWPAVPDLILTAILAVVCLLIVIARRRGAVVDSVP